VVLLPFKIQLPTIISCRIIPTGSSHVRCVRRRLDRRPTKVAFGVHIVTSGSIYVGIRQPSVPVKRTSVVKITPGYRNNRLITISTIGTDQSPAPVDIARVSIILFFPPAVPMLSSIMIQKNDWSREYSSEWTRAWISCNDMSPSCQIFT
jgi:hypothetical protein